MTVADVDSRRDRKQSTSSSEPCAGRRQERGKRSLRGRRLTRSRPRPILSARSTCRSALDKRALRARAAEAPGRVEPAAAPRAACGGVDDPRVRRRGRRRQGRRDPPHHGGARRARLARSSRSPRRPTRSARSTTCGGSGGICRAPAASRSSIAAGTAACSSSASRGFATRGRVDARAYAEINQFEEPAGRPRHRPGEVLDPHHQGRAAPPLQGPRGARTSSAGRSPPTTGATARSGTPTSSAVNDMIERTSTRQAPWTLVEGNDKSHYARIGYGSCKRTRVRSAAAVVCL